MPEQPDVGDAARCEVQRSGAVAEIALNRPEVRNALDYATVAELVHQIRSLGEDREVRAILLRGNGESFCAGGDLREFERTIGQSAFRYHETGKIWGELLLVIRQLDVPVIVAAHGSALAGGTGIVAAADVALAAEGTRFGLPEVRVGLFPAIVLATVAEATGFSAARELALTGRRIEATEAQRIGLVHRVIAGGELLDAARATAGEMSGFGRDVLALGKEQLRHMAAMPLEDATAYGQAMRGAYMETDDFRNAIARFTKPRRD